MENQNLFPKTLIIGNSLPIQQSHILDFKFLGYIKHLVTHDSKGDSW